MKISELERNPIKKSGGSGELWTAYKKKDYPRELPIMIGDLEVRHKQDGKYVVLSVWDQNKLVANLIVEPTSWRGMKLYHVGGAYVHKNYQGQGIGYELYRGLVVLLNLSLTSVGSHSPGAQKLWLRLSQDKKINAWGLDVDTQEVFAVGPHENQPELASKVPGKQVYDNLDTGLILTKVGSPVDQEMQKLEKVSKRGKLKRLPDERLQAKRPDRFGVKTYSSLAEPE